MVDCRALAWRFECFLHPIKLRLLGCRSTRSPAPCVKQAEVENAIKVLKRETVAWEKVLSDGWVISFYSQDARHWFADAWSRIVVQSRKPF